MFEDTKIPMKKRVEKMAIILEKGSGEKAIACVSLLLYKKGRIRRFNATFDALWVAYRLIDVATIRCRES